ncbi:hypothetical protein CCR95_20875 [Thiocystis minor]|uniref:hypothetical protein n=1 Tax=Thiocystis minor TaxID=61597 RepID=UPI0019120F8F|nr:hypothetical protein [Thiocystis minor]MBK5966460.1 hypothetical protein [Thiocystis minor]
MKTTTRTPAKDRALLADVLDHSSTELWLLSSAIGTAALLGDDIVSAIESNSADYPESFNTRTLSAILRLIDAGSHRLGETFEHIRAIQAGEFSAPEPEPVPRREQTPEEKASLIRETIERLQMALKEVESADQDAAPMAGGTE